MLSLALCSVHVGHALASNPGAEEGGKALYVGACWSVGVRGSPAVSGRSQAVTSVAALSTVRIGVTTTCRNYWVCMATGLAQKDLHVLTR